MTHQVIKLFLLNKTTKRVILCNHLHSTLISQLGAFINKATSALRYIIFSGLFVYSFIPSFPVSPGVGFGFVYVIKIRIQLPEARGSLFDEECEFDDGSKLLITLRRVLFLLHSPTSLQIPSSCQTMCDSQKKWKVVGAEI